MYLTTLRNSINLFLSNPTWDILLLLFFFAAIFIYGLVVGRNRIIVLLLASYPSVLISERIPYLKNFSESLNVPQTIFLKSFYFFFYFLFIFWILGKAGFSRKEFTKKTGQVILLSFIGVGLWASIIFGYVISLNAEIIKLAPLTQLLFGSNLAHLIWLILPILVLYWLEKN